MGLMWMSGVFKAEEGTALLQKVSVKLLRNGKNSYFGSAILRDASSDTSEKRPKAGF